MEARLDSQYGVGSIAFQNELFADSFKSHWEAEVVKLNFFLRKNYLLLAGYDLSDSHNLYP